MSNSIRVLLVEDDADDAFIFTRRCPPSFIVHHVKSAEAALDSFKIRQYDVCFTDYQLSFKSGLDLVKEMRAANIDTPVIVITGHDIETLGENALLAGATDFVMKDELQTNMIQRTARWSMVRRHVELMRRRERARTT